MNQNHFLKQPLITESTTKDAARGIFTFQVKKSASKGQIKQAIESIFDVDVVKITTQTTPPKLYRSGKLRRLKRKTKGKKAKVQLKKGQKISLFDLDKKDS